MVPHQVEVVQNMFSLMIPVNKPKNEPFPVWQSNEH